MISSRRSITRVVFASLVLGGLVCGLLFADIVTTRTPLAPQSLLPQTVLKTEAALRAGICRALSPIRLGWYRKPYITPEQIAALERYLEPGDIILVRDNLKLSSFFIPGFWTHAALYLGRPGRAETGFAESPMLDGTTGFPGRKTPLADPVPLPGPCGGRIMEAVPEGVAAYPLSHLGPADYLAVLRPLLPRETKRKALENARALNGFDYDFYFDFDSKDALICSELIYRVYHGADGDPGLRFSLYRRHGRRFMSANDIAKKYSLDYAASQPQLVLVLFAGGREAQTVGMFQDASDFRDSWRRR